MPFIETKVFQVKCDGCGETYDTGEFVPYYDNPAQAAEMVMDSDWQADLVADPPTAHCPDCATFPDEEDEE